MTVDQFIAELERHNLLSDRMMAKLRQSVAEVDRPLSAKALANFLVKKKHLTQQQATEVLNGLLMSGIDLDEVGGTEAVAGENPEDSSVFPAHLTGVRKRAPLPPEDDDNEIQLAPIDEEVNSAKPERRDTLTPDDEDVPVLAPLKSLEENRPRPKPAAKKAKREVVEDLAEIGDPVEATEREDSEQIVESTASPRMTTSLSRGGKKKPKKKAKPTKGKKQWDSPLILLGGGGLALLLLCGATVWWLLNWESGDQKLSLARDALDQGNYSQAIKQYEEFLTSSPRHPEHGLARVQLAMVRIRQPTEGNDFSTALDTAQKELQAIEDDEKFDEAHAELASLLPQIALGLAKQAEAADAGSDDASRLTEEANKALAICNNLAYVPKTLRDEAKLTVVGETLERVERRQQTHLALTEGLKAMDQAVAEGKAIASYAAHRQLVRDHPELAGDASLAEMVQKTTAAEQAAIRFVEEEHPAATRERPVPWVASLAVAHHRMKPAAALPGVDGTACVRVEGAIYGLEAATGRLLWRRYVGYASTAWPIPIERDVIVPDTARHDLLRLDAATGRLKWRQEIGEPFAEPLVVGQRAFVAAKSGRLYVVDLNSAARSGFLQFAQPLLVRPTADRVQQRLYVPGERASVYSIAMKDLACLGVFYLGHSEGAIQTPPSAIMDKLAVVENDGVETSRLRLLSLDDKGAVAKVVVDRRLTGLPVAPPIVAGRRLIVITDRGQIEVYDIAAGEGGDALALVATRDPAGAQPLVRHVAVTGRNIWIADNKLAKYSIVPTGNRLPVEEIENSFAGATFDHPLVVFGNTLLHVRRPKGRAGTIVAASDIGAGRTLWETQLAVPPAGRPIVDDAAKALTVANAEGVLFHFDEAAIRSRVQDTPVAAQSAPAELPALNSSVDLGQGRAAFCAPDSDRLLLYNPAQGNSAARWVTLESPLASAVTPLGDGFLAPLKIGQVFYLNAADGSKLATPFQPRLEPQTTLQYQPPGVLEKDPRRFVIADGREKIYLVALVDQPQPQLEQVAEANAGPYPIESPVIVLGDTAMAVGGSSHLVRFQLPSLEPAGESNLPAPVVWGPFRAGNAMLLATADGQLTAISAAGEIIWKAPVEHGDFAGEPLVLPDSILVAYRKGIVERRALADGKPLGAINVEHPLASGPAAFLQRIVVAANDGTLLVVDQP